jgi:hypothetical protein
MVMSHSPSCIAAIIFPWTLNHFSMNFPWIVTIEPGKVRLDGLQRPFGSSVSTKKSRCQRPRWPRSAAPGNVWLDLSEGLVTFVNQYIPGIAHGSVYPSYTWTKPNITNISPGFLIVYLVGWPTKDRKSPRKIKKNGVQNVTKPPTHLKTWKWYSGKPSEHVWFSCFKPVWWMNMINECDEW